MAVVTTNLGTITAYGDAVAAGYTGTKAEFQQALNDYTEGIANASEALTKANTNTTSIGTLANLATDVKTDLVSAVNEIDGDINQLNADITANINSVKSDLGELDSFSREYHAEETKTASVSVTSGKPVGGATRHLIDVNILTGKEFTFIINGESGILTKYTLYANGSSIRVNCYLGTKYTLTASEDITYISIYASASSAVSTGTVNAILEVITYNENSLEAQIKNTSNTVGKLSNTVDNAIFDIQVAHNAENTFPSDLFINAGLRNGKITGDKYRVASDNIFEFPYPVAITIASGYRIGVHSFDSNGVFISDSGWKTSNYSLPSYTPFKIVISKVPEDSSTTADIEEFVNAVTVLSAKSNKTNVYYGDAIVLNNDNQTVHGVDIMLWKDFLGSGIENLSDYALHLNQSMTIFGGYVFLFSANGICTILDYDTKEIVGTCNFEPATNQHANSAQFTDVYYDTNDEFPLMLLSRCGNSASGSGNDECLIYRINRSGTTFTMTLVNTIEPNFATYGASWGIDSNTNMLYMSTTVNGTWQVTENNPIMFSAFEFPAKSKILSGSPITIEESDIIAKMYIPHYTLQGMAVNGGVIYTGITYNGHNVWAVDIWKNRILSKIHLTSSYEVEGVSVYDGKIYVSQKSGTDTTAVNPCKIYELSF